MLINPLEENGGEVSIFKHINDAVFLDHPKSERSFTLEYELASWIVKLSQARYIGDLEVISR